MTVAFDIGVLPQRPVSELVDLAVRAEDSGFRGLWIADSQSIFRDVYVALAACALQTHGMLLATGVTNPLTRHPAVTASSIATLNELSGGRAVLGMGCGESAVRTLGMRPSTLARLEKTTHLIRSLLAGESVDYRGSRLEMPWSSAQVPIYLASSGPKSLRLAGAIADGVLFQVGATTELVGYALDNIRQGAEEAGRNFEEIQLCLRLACSVSEDRDQARADIRPYAAAAALTTFSSIPDSYISPQIREDVGRLKEQYNYYKHASSEADHRALVTDRLLDAVAIAGTPRQAVPGLRRLVDLGVHRIVMPVTVPDPVSWIHTLAEQVFPHLT
ncbi:MAG: LLM class flavin-dependent oxidoreductase [Acidobacteriota bacterium]